MLHTKLERRLLFYQRGATLVEATVILPVVMFVLFGIIQWGLIFCAQLTVTNAAATAGRLIAGQETGASTVSDPEVIDTARSAVAPFLVPANLGVQITPPITQLGGANTYSVRCTYNYPLLLKYVVPGQSGGFLQITSTTTAR